MRTRSTLKDLQDAAAKRGGVCLSTKYTLITDKYEWMCKEGHRWFAQGTSVKNANTWCPKCAGFSNGIKVLKTCKYNIDTLIKVASFYRGTCLTQEYKGLNSEHSFECIKGHVWSTTAKNVLYYKNWCPVCKASGNGIAPFPDTLVGIQRRKESLRDNSQNEPLGPDSQNDLSEPESKKQYKYCLDDLKEIAAKHEGECLSLSYRGAASSYKFRCRMGHEWETRGSNILEGRWCIQCARSRSVIKREETTTIPLEIKNAANRLGFLVMDDSDDSGYFLSDNYQLKCNCGKIFTCNGINILNKLSYCPNCTTIKEIGENMSFSPVEKLNGILLLKDIASKKGGKCLDNKFRGMHHRYRLKCKQGHFWTDKGLSIKEGNWCVICESPRRILDVQPKYTISDMDVMARIRGGRFLSKRFRTINEKYYWGCSCGNKFSEYASMVRIGAWCPNCNDSDLGKNGNRMRSFFDSISERHGILLSDEPNMRATYLKKYLFCCGAGHIWISRAESVIRQGTWCPKCAPMKNEATAITIAEDILGIELKKCRPTWLVFNNGKPLELDGYNKEHKIVVEYNGEQHYKMSRLFHKTEEDFEKQLERDFFKKNVCIERGLVYIEIPFFRDRHKAASYEEKYNWVKHYILKGFKRAGRPVPARLTVHNGRASPER